MLAAFRPEVAIPMRDEDMMWFPAFDYGWTRHKLSVCMRNLMNWQMNVRYFMPYAPGQWSG
jgi:hypothetical protein